MSPYTTFPACFLFTLCCVQVKDIKARVMRESLAVGSGGVGAAKGSRGARARLEADGVTAR